MTRYITQNLLWSQGQTVVLAIITQLILVIFLYSYLPNYLAPLTVLFVVSQLLFALYFFRNPDRSANKALELDAILAPADGKIVAYEQLEFQEPYAHKISIFLSPLDVHVQWAPVEGKVSNICYKPGKFTPAFLPKSSELNERMDVELIHPKGTILMRQIAGTVARRIVVWIHSGQELRQAQKYGMIKFGSRVDIFLPKQVTVLATPGQRVQGGITMVGRWL